MPQSAPSPAGGAGTRLVFLALCGHGAGGRACVGRPTGAAGCPRPSLALVCPPPGESRRSQRCDSARDLRLLTLAGGLRRSHTSETKVKASGDLSEEPQNSYLEIPEAELERTQSPAAKGPLSLPPQSLARGPASFGARHFHLGRLGRRCRLGWHCRLGWYCRLAPQAGRTDTPGMGSTRISTGGPWTPAASRPACPRAPPQGPARLAGECIPVTWERLPRGAGAPDRGGAGASRRPLPLPSSGGSARAHGGQTRQGVAIVASERRWITRPHVYL